MSKTIDSKVVEMRFDNSKFEAGAKESMNTLTRLKQALKFDDVDKGISKLSKVNNAIDTSGIAQNVEKISNRFSALGIVAATVITDITRSLEGKLATAVSFVSDSIVQGGIKRAMNIENAHFQLQALLKDEQLVQAVMDDAMTSVDGTAYAYDEAAKAAAQFAATGLEAGEEMVSALKGITGVAAMTNSEYESISTIFTTIAGNGRLMGDQLLQLSSRGLNAASTIAEYFREVQGQSEMTEATVREMVTAGQISFKTFAAAMNWAFGESAERANETFTGSLANMKSALARIGAGFVSPFVEQNGELVKLFNALRVQINAVKSALVFDEQESAISGLAAATGLSTEELDKMFTKISNNGSVSMKQLNKLSQNGADAATALTKYINGVSDGSIRASYAITTAVSELTNGTEVSTEDIKRFVKEGKIDINTFTAAMETEFGNQRKLSKQVTDYLLDRLQELTNFITSIDMTKPMEAIGNGFQGLGNIFKALLSVLKPIASAFAEVFLNIKPDSVIDITAKFAEFTSKLKLSDESSQNLKDTFKGLFDVIALVGNVFASLLSAILPISEPIGATGNSVLALTGALGRMLSSFVEFVSNSKSFNVAFDAISSVLSVVYSIISDNIKAVGNFIKSIDETAVAQAVLQKLSTLFAYLSSVAGAAITAVASGAVNLKDKLSVMIPDGLSKVISTVGEKLSYLKTAITNFDMSKIGAAFKQLGTNIETAVVSIGKLVSQQKPLEAIKTVFTAIGTALVTFGKNILSALSSITGIGSSLNQVEEPISAVSMSAEKLTLVSKGFDISGLLESLGSIGTAFTSLFTVTNGSEMTTGMTNLSTFGTTLNESVNGEGVTSTIGTVKNTLSDFLNWLSQHFVNPFSGLSLYEVLGLGTAGTAIAVIIKQLSIFKDMVKSILNVSSSVSKLASSVAGIGTSIKNVVNSLQGVSKAYARNLNATAILKLAAAIAVLAAAIGLLSLCDSEKVIAAAGAIALVATVLFAGFTKLKQAMNEADTTANAVNNVTKGIKSALTKLAKAFEIKALGTSILKVAASIGIVAIALIALGKSYSSDKESLEAAGKMMLAIVAVLGGITALALIVNKKFDADMEAIEKLGVGLVAISASLLVAVIALNKLAKIEVDESGWTSRFAALAVVFAGLGVMVIALGVASAIAGDGSLNLGAFVGMAALLLAAVSSLKKLFKMDLPNDYGTKLGILTLIFVELSAVMVAMGAASRLAGGKMSGAKVMLAMSALITKIVAALGVLSLMDGSAILKGAVALGAVLLEVAVGMLAASKLSNEESHKTVEAMTNCVKVITASLAALSLLKGEALFKAATSLGSILLVLATDFLAVSKISSDKALAVVIAMTASIAVITAALVILSTQPWEGLVAGATSLGTVLLAVAAAIKIIGNVKIDMSALATFGLAVASVVVIAYALKEISEQPWEGLLTGALAISSVIVAIGAAIKLMDSAKINLSAIVAFGLGIAAMAAIGYELQQLAGQPWQGMLAAAASISLVMVSLSALMVAVGLIKPNLAAMATVALGVAAIIVIADVLVELAGQPWDGLLSAAIAISAVMVSLTALMGVCAVVGAAAPAAIAGMVVFDLFIANFLLVITALYKMFSSKEAQSLLNGGISVLIQIGDAIGEFIGAIVGGAIKQASASLPDVGTNLSKFMENLEPFITGIKSLDEKISKSCGYLVDMMLKVTGAEVLSGIASIFGMDVSLSKFGEELSTFGPYIKAFAADVENVNSKSVEGAASAAKMMAKIYDYLPANGGLAEKLFGSKSLMQFGMELSLFGPFIALFAQQVQNVKKTAVEGAAQAAKMMAKIYDYLPGIGGFAQKIFGTKSLAEFGLELSLFGPYIATFADDVKDVKKTAVEGAAKAAKMMASLASELPATGGFAQQIFGSHNLSEFGEELEAFGPHIATFADDVKDVNKSAVEGAAAAAQMMAEIANNLPKSGGWAQIFTGDKSLAKFGEQMEAFGGYMKTYADTVSKIDSSKWDKSISQMESLIAMTKNLSGVDTTVMKTFGSSLESLAKTGVEKFVTGFQTSASTATKAVTTFISGVNSALSGDNVNFTKSGKTVISTFATGVRTQMSTSLTSLQTKMTTYGKNIVEGLVTGINNNKSKVTTAMTNLATAVDKAFCLQLEIHSPSKVMEEKGENVVEGVAEGIENTTPKVESAMSKVVAKITKTFDKLFLSLEEIQEEMLVVATDDVVNYFDIYGKTLSEKFSIINDAIEQQLSTYTQLKEAESAKIEEIQNELLEKEEAFLELQQEMESRSLIKTEEMTNKQLKAAYKKAKKEYEAAKKAATQIAEINNGRLDEEQQYWQDLLSIYQSGVDSEEYLIMTLYEFEMNIAKQASETVSSYLDSLESTTQSVMNSISLFSEVVDEEASSLQSSIDSIMTAMGLFDEVEESDAVSGSDLILRLQDQVVAYKNFSMIYDQVTQKLAGTTIGEYVKTLDISNMAELQAILDMTETELNHYIELYEAKIEYATELAKEQAEQLSSVVTKDDLKQNLKDQIEVYESFGSELNQLVQRIGEGDLADYIRTLGVDNKTEIEALLSMTDDELTEYSNLYAQKLKASSEIAQIQIKATQDEAEATLQEIFGTTRQVSLFDFADAFDGTIDSINAYLAKLASSLEVADGVQAVSDHLQYYLNTSAERLTAIAEMKEKYAAMLSGEEIATNLIAGVNSKSTALTSILVSNTNDALDTATWKTSSTSTKAGTSISSSLISAMNDTMEAKQNTLSSQVTSYLVKANTKTTEAADTGTQISCAVIDGLTSIIETFEETGVNVVQAFIDGLESKLEDAEATVEKLTQLATEAAAQAAKIASYSSSSSSSSSSSTTRVTSGTTVTSSSGTTLTASTNAKIGTTYSALQAANASSTSSTTSSSSSSSSGSTTNVTNNYNYTQNNTSPTSLSSATIYTNTATQLATLKASVSAVTAVVRANRS